MIYNFKNDTLFFNRYLLPHFKLVKMILIGYAWLKKKLTHTR